MEFIIGVLTVVAAGCVYQVYQLTQNARHTDSLINTAFNEFRQLDAERKWETERGTTELLTKIGYVDATVAEIHNTVQDLTVQMGAISSKLNKSKPKPKAVSTKSKPVTKKARK